MNATTLSNAQYSATDEATLTAGLRSPAILVASLVLLSLYYLSRKPKGKMPPGPKGLPIIGNIHQLSDENWLQFTEWKFKYGPLVRLNLGGTNTIVLNTHKVAADILDKRASIYSDRPHFIVAGDMLTGGLLLVFSRYGDLWRRMRRAAHEGLYSHAAENYYTLQETEATVLVDGLLKNYEAWDDHLKRTAASQIMAMVYDTLPIKDHEDPLIVRVNDLVQRLVKAAYPGEHLVEFFPWLNKLPDWIAPWKPWANEWHRKDSEMFLNYYKEVRDRVLAGDERPSLVSSLVKRSNENKFSDKENAWVAGVMISAGAETTAAVMSWLMLAMTLNPEVQRKCHEELDNVVGRHRMPNFNDYDSLPTSHMSIADDVYEGYFIPKGTLVIFKRSWTRHLLKTAGEYKLKPVHPATKGEGHVTYGFGRRICVGRYVANNTLFIDIAHLLWALTLNKAPGEVYNDHANYKEGLVVRPKPFRTIMKPRFAEAKGIVAEAKERLVAAASQR
ncbi:cytochrome P450 [Dendrothele bispora CBS 962.96]|uniref:Cytochrome P450 n=1 Tax=Dendrothele bispora (strain CBS 962.96) TaxID=1314807 RepID=A0A4S8MBC5_DENBC|nr:cytochrome P450 [Dendrothele bispora CBS 962.96]